MAKKKPTKKAEKLPNFRDRICKTEEEWLERLILMSERAITGQGTSIDDFFRQQAERIRKKLEELRLKMEYLKEYLKALARILGFIGGVFLVLSSVFQNPIAIYLVFSTILIASAGPIQISINKRPT